MKKEHDAVNHPSHYAESMPPIQVECIDFSATMGFCEGNAFKYVWRAGRKGDVVEDLRKALWYLGHEVDADDTTPDIVWSFLFRKWFSKDIPTVEKYRLLALSAVMRGAYRSAEEHINKWLKHLEGSDEE